MARFIPTRHKKFIVLISYSYKFQASEPGVFLTNFVNFNADKCQNNRLEGRNINHREHRDKKLKRVRRFRRLTQIKIRLKTHRDIKGGVYDFMRF